MGPDVSKLSELAMELRTILDARRDARVAREDMLHHQNWLGAEIRRLRSELRALKSEARTSNAAWSASRLRLHRLEEEIDEKEDELMHLLFFTLDDLEFTDIIRGRKARRLIAEIKQVKSRIRDRTERETVQDLLSSIL